MKAFDHDMISRYLDGEMNADEVKAFEVQMQTDAELQSEVQLYSEVNETLKMKLHPGENEMALRNTLEEMRTQYFSKEVISGRPKARVVSFKRTRWITAVAAVFIGIVMLTVWSPWKKEDLYQQYAAIQMPGVVERGAAADSSLKKATDNFNEKKFAAAVPQFEAVLKNDPQNSFANYYYAIALLESGQTERSRNELMQLYNGTSLFRYDAAFYMALSYLKEKDKTNCIVWLNKIPADAGLYGKAQELLKKL
jgi:tetratricopeptide (TPR) repeat protein